MHNAIDSDMDPSLPTDANLATLFETALVAVLRGGDGLALSKGKRFDPGDPEHSFPLSTRADLTFLLNDKGEPTCAKLMAINSKAKGVEARRKLPRYLPMSGKFLSPGAMLWMLVKVWDPVPAHLEKTTPLFRDSSGRPFTADYVRQRLRRAMSAAGRDGSVYGVHSLRIGGGTAMNFEHAPAATIKAAGVWSSDAYKAYLRRCGQDVLTVARAVCSSEVDDLATDFLEIDDELDDTDFE